MSEAETKLVEFLKRLDNEEEPEEDDDLLTDLLDEEPFIKRRDDVIEPPSKEYMTFVFDKFESKKTLKTESKEEEEARTQYEQLKKELTMLNEPEKYRDSQIHLETLYIKYKDDAEHYHQLLSRLTIPSAAGGGSRNNSIRRSSGCGSSS